MPNSQEELLGLPARLGRYELRRVLGRGGMGRVVLGHDPVLRRDVALKLVEPMAVAPEDMPELRFMFHREARATAALHHPNIVEVFDYSGPDAELLFLACELLDGLTLRDVLERQGRLNGAVAAACGYELAEALEHAHARGIVHRDLKPENVFWSEAGRLVISDFGIAKAFTGTARLGGTVRFGATSLYGSPSHMAPEQIKGEPVGPHTDLFALGTLLFEVATGVPAFDGPDVQAILDAVSRGTRAPVPPPVELPSEFLELIDRLLAHEPAGRPARAGEVAESLRAVLDALGVADPRRALAHFGSGLRAATSPACSSAKPEDVTATAAPQGARAAPIAPGETADERTLVTTHGRMARDAAAVAPRALARSARQSQLTRLVVAMILGAAVGAGGALALRAMPERPAATPSPPKSGAPRVDAAVVFTWPQAELSVDGVRRGVVTSGTHLPLDAGPHELTLQVASERQRREVLVLAGTAPVFRF